ncbi:MAG: ChbG/HpnK family deacetylase [Hespellia sp.]|nr:ChbG/HpnK family deacetylase [Hespellia sp.]
MSKIELHADDFAVSAHASKDIIALLKEDVLDSISIIPNMKCFEETMELLRDADLMKVPASVHLNFMEGKSCAALEDVPLLVDENGFFKVTWFSLFFDSFKPDRRRALTLQLACEIESQIRKIQTAMQGEYQLRIDSHQHTHMIPVVRDALLLAIDRMGEDVTFVRLAKEPLVPFLKHSELYREYSVVNLIKNVLLWALAFPMEKQLKKRNIPYSYLFGLMLSGNMNAACVEQLYLDMAASADKKEQDLEILFHPGSVLESEISEENVQHSFIEFHLSSSRKSEYEAATVLDKLRKR